MDTSQSGITPIVGLPSDGGAGADPDPTSTSPLPRNRTESHQFGNMGTAALDPGHGSDAESGHDPASPDRVVENHQAETGQLGDWEGYNDNPTSGGSSFVPDPKRIEIVMSVGLSQEDAETYLRHFGGDTTRAADQYWLDHEAREKVFRDNNVSSEWRTRLWTVIDNYQEALDLWKKIQDVVKLLGLGGRTEEETWHILIEERFEPDRVQKRLTWEAGYGGRKVSNGGDTHLGENWYDEDDDKSDVDGDNTDGHDGNADRDGDKGDGDGGNTDGDGEDADRDDDLYRDDDDRDNEDYGKTRFFY